MTLYEYIKQTEDWEVTVFDKDYDIEVYFYKNDDEEDLDSWDKSMKKFSKLLVVDNISSRGVTVNMSELIESKMENLKERELFIVVDIDWIMDDIEAIISGYASETWLENFVSALM